MAKAKLVILKDGQKIKEHDLENDLLMGRADVCEVKLDHQSISREHAQFRVIDEGIEVIKKSQFAPLAVNGADCTSAILKQGDVVMAGPFMIQVQLEVQEAQKAPVEATQPELENQQEISLDEGGVQEEQVHFEQIEVDEVISDIPKEESSDEFNLEAPEVSGSIDPKIEFNEEQNDGPSMGSHEFDLGDSSLVPEEISSFEEVGETDQTALISSSHMSPKLTFAPGLANVEEFEIEDEPVVIGRGKNSDIVINDKKASRKHATFEKIGSKFYIIDHESVNGTYLNGVQIEKEELSGDDVIRIGDSEFTFRVTHLDYENNKDQFLNVEEQIEPSASLGISDQVPVALDGLDSSPNIANESTHSGVFTMGGAPEEQVDPGLLGKLKQAPKRKVIIYTVFLIAFGLLMFDEEPSQTPNEQRKVASSQKKDQKKEVAFENLSEEQKRFVESQRELAFEHYRNQEYDKALFEIRKIFQIIPDYKNSKEIERYAVEGKRKLERLKQEKQQKEEQERIQRKIADLKAKIEKLMELKQYDQAKALFPEIIALDPENKQMQKWRAQIQNFYDDLERAERQKRIQAQLLEEGWAIYKDAVSLKKDNKCFDAIGMQQKADRLEVSDRKLKNAFSSLITDCREIISNQVSPLLEEAKLAEESGNEVQAYKTYEKVLIVDPLNRDGKNGEKRLRNLLRERAKLAYTEAVVAESYSDFETARLKFEECLNTAPKGDSYRVKAKRKLNRFLSLQRLEASE